MIVHSTGSGSVGPSVHHGAWDQRTQYPPVGFWNEVSRSGIGDYFHANPPEGLWEGTLEQLPKCHRGAFDAAIRAVRAREDGKE